MAQTTEALEAYLYRQALTGLQSIPAKEALDVYAVSFYVWADEDDPRRMVLSVSYNTNAHAEQRTPKAAGGSDIGWPMASSSAEARWNYAFWHQQDIATLGTSDGPSECLFLRAAWVGATGSGYSDEESDEEEDEDFERTLGLGDQICSQFWQMAGRVARRLQQEDVLSPKFGRSLPIIVHDLEYAEPTEEMTRFANPGGEADAFLLSKWQDP